MECICRLIGLVLHSSCSTHLHPAGSDMAGSKRRRLAWLIQNLEEMRSTNASRKDRAIRAWLRRGGIMTMIVEALALAEELDVQLGGPAG